MAESASYGLYREPSHRRADTKDSYNVSEDSDQPSSSFPEDTTYGDGYGNSGIDSKDMLRLGKKQEFKRNFDLWSSIGFVAIYSKHTASVHLQSRDTVEHC